MAPPRIELGYDPRQRSGLPLAYGAYPLMQTITVYTSCEIVLKNTIYLSFLLFTTIMEPPCFFWKFHSFILS